MMETAIPFMGFYETIHHDRVADSISNELFGKMYEEVESDDELDQMQPLWKPREVEYCREYTRLISEALEIPLTFKEMISPREYNFRTDRIFAEISKEDLEKLKERVDYEMMKARVKEEFTSYDGFTSFYDNDYDNWLKQEEPFDHNQICTLIEAVLNHDVEFEYDLSYEVSI